MTRLSRKLMLPAFCAMSLAALGYTAAVHAQQAQMTFFITSKGPGKGADLGGLAGADAHCAALAKAAGSSLTNWRAYLSTTAPRGQAGVNARDRIGNGPWHNAKGVMVAKDLAELHSDAAKIDLQNGLDETSKPVNGRGQKPNRHDILTGSDPQGMYSTAGGDTTCGNWTKSSDDGSAIVGHHDRKGLADTRHMKSWNSAHGSRGCSQEKLRSSGGDGLVYCFSAQ